MQSNVNPGQTRIKEQLTELLSKAEQAAIMYHNLMHWLAILYGMLGEKQQTFF